MNYLSSFQLSEDSHAVVDLKSSLLDNKEKIQSANKDQVYSIIDKLMSRVAKKYNINGKELHDAWVKKYDKVPDSWIMSEASRTPSLKNPKDNPCWKGYKPVGTKKKNGKTVPNCVPKESVEEGKTPTVVYIEVPEGDYRKSYDAPYMVVKSNSPEWNKYDEFDEDDMERAAHDVNFVPTDKFDSNVDEAEYQGRDVPLGKPMKGDVKKSKVYVKGPKGNVVKVNFGDKKMRIKKSNPERRKSFRARHNCDNPGPRHKAKYWSCRAW
jgi:hypothetical protein